MPFRVNYRNISGFFLHSFFLFHRHYTTFIFLSQQEMHNPLFLVYRKSVSGNASPHRKHWTGKRSRCAGAESGTDPGEVNLWKVFLFFGIIITASRGLPPSIPASLCSDPAAPSLSDLPLTSESTRRTLYISFMVCAIHAICSPCIR